MQHQLRLATGPQCDGQQWMRGGSGLKDSGRVCAHARACLWCQHSGWLRSILSHPISSVTDCLQSTDSGLHHDSCYITLLSSSLIMMNFIIDVTKNPQKNEAGFPCPMCSTTVSGAWGWCNWLSPFLWWRLCCDVPLLVGGAGILTTGGPQDVTHALGHFKWLDFVLFGTFLDFPAHPGFSLIKTTFIESMEKVFSDKHILLGLLKSKAVLW